MIDKVFLKASKRMFGVIKASTEILTTPIWELMNPEKSIDVILNASEELEEEFKVSLQLDYINQLIFEKVVHQSEKLESFLIDAKNHFVFLEGKFVTKNYLLAKLIKLESVNYRVKLKPIWVKQNAVRFRIVNFQIWNSVPKKIDIVKIISQFDVLHKRYILKTIVELFPEFLSLTRLNNEIRVNLDYFLKKVHTDHHIKIKKIFPEKHKIHFLVISNLLIRSIIDFFGSNVIELSKYSESNFQI
jgi:hypothetical protein